MLDTIYIKPIGGLCNRLRAIDSALILSRRINYNLVVFWQKDQGLNSNWEDLFLNPKEFKIVPVITRFERLKHRTIYAKSIFHPVYNFVFKAFGYRTIWSFEFMNLFKTHFNFSSLSSHPKIYIQSLSRFMEDQDSFNFIHLNPSIQYQINLISQNFSDSMVGMHIRRTDHLKSIQNSPTDLFTCKAEEMLLTDPSTKVFLACDDPEVKSLFRKKFGEKLITAEIELNRNSLTGMEGAVIDLFLLAKCNVIYGSFGSSFSKTAAEISNIPIHFLKTQLS